MYIVIENSTLKEQIEAWEEEVGFDPIDELEIHFEQLHPEAGTIRVLRGEISNEMGLHFVSRSDAWRGERDFILGWNARLCFLGG